MFPRDRSARFAHYRHTSKLAFVTLLFVVLVLLVATSFKAHAQSSYSQQVLDRAIRARNKAVGENTQNVKLGELVPPPVSRFGVTTEAASAEKALPNAEQLDVGQNTTTTATLPLRNMQALGQMADSEDLQKYLRAFQTRRVPVSYMTMMMVENGAATGAMGALSGLTGLYDNTIQSHGLQLAQMQAFDHSGLAIKQYQRSLLEQMQVEGHKDAYVHAMWATNADVLDLNAPASDQRKREVNRYVFPEQLASLRAPSVDPNINPNQLKPTDSGAKRLLSAMLFDDAIQKHISSSSSLDTQRDNQTTLVDALKREYIERLGDMEFELQDKNGATMRITRFIQPVVIDGRKGIDAADYRNIVSVWSNLQTILREYCAYRAQDGNYSVEIFDKERPAGVLERKQTERDGASAPDIPLTVPFVDSLYKLMVPRQAPTPGECNQIFDPRVEAMPSLDDDQQGGAQSLPVAGQAGMSATISTFDDCKLQPKRCLRNKVIHAAVRLVARSRTLHEYMILLRTAEQFARQPEYQGLLRDHIEHALEGVSVESEIEDNRERWISFSNFLGKLAQGQATGSGLSSMISSSSPNQ